MSHIYTRIYTHFPYEKSRNRIIALILVDTRYNIALRRRGGEKKPHFYLLINHTLSRVPSFLKTSPSWWSAPSTAGLRSPLSSHSSSTRQHRLSLSRLQVRRTLALYDQAQYTRSRHVLPWSRFPEYQEAQDDSQEILRILYRLTVETTTTTEITVHVSRLVCLMITGTSRPFASTRCIDTR